MVSPLLALMRHQVLVAGAAGLVAAAISFANVDDWDSVVAQLDTDSLDVLLVSRDDWQVPDSRIGLV